jgi:hypothetical protein
MTQVQFSALQRVFDRSISLILLSLGAVVTGAVAIVGG